MQFFNNDKAKGSAGTHLVCADGDLAVMTIGSCGITYKDLAGNAITPTEVTGEACGSSGKVPVYICEMVDNAAGWDVRWWYGDDSLPATPLGADKPAVWMPDDTVDVGEAFDLDAGGEGATTSAPPSAQVFGLSLAPDGVLSISDAPGYDPAVHGALASQSIRTGWVRVPDTQDEVWISSSGFHNCTAMIFAGYTPDKMKAGLYGAAGFEGGVSAPAPADAQGYGALRLAKANAVYQVDGYWYVHVQSVVSSPEGETNTYVVYSLTEATGASFTTIPESEVFAGLHVFKQTVKLVDEDYEIQDGESFAPCDEIDVSDAFYSRYTPEYVDTKLLCETDPAAVGSGTFSYWHKAEEGGSAVTVDPNVNTLLSVWPTGPGSHVSAPDFVSERKYFARLYDVGLMNEANAADPTLGWTRAGQNEADQCMFRGLVDTGCKPIKFRFLEASSNESEGIFVAPIGGDFILAASQQGVLTAGSGTNDSYAETVEFPAGIYDVASAIYDPLGSAGHTIEYSYDNGETWDDVTADFFGIADPDVAPCCFLAGIEADGTVRNVETGEVLDIADKKYSWHTGTTSAPDPCECLPKTAVYTRTVSPPAATGWESKWWDAVGSAIPVERILPATRGMSSQQCDHRATFPLVNGVPTHPTTADHTRRGDMSSALGELASPGYAASHGDPSQAQLEGWIQVPHAQEEVRLLAVSHGSSAEFFSGYTRESLRLVDTAVSVNYNTFANGGGPAVYDIALRREDAVVSDADGWYVYVHANMVDASSTGSIRIKQRDYVVPDGATESSLWKDVPGGSRRYGAPTVTHAVRYESGDYAFLPGESPVPHKDT